MPPSDLWQQILAAPSDQNLQAQFISTLAQSRDPRAEIFRLDAELEKYPVYYTQHESLLRHYETSLAAWRAQLDPLAKSWLAQLTFIKGWPIQLTIAAKDFAAHAHTVIATIPLRHLNLTDIKSAPQVFNLPQLNQIASIKASHQPWSPAALRALTDSRQLTALRWLDLSHTNLTDADVEILAASPHLRAIEHLDLTNNPCRDPVDASGGSGSDGITGMIVPESIYLPLFGQQLEARHGTIPWLHALSHFMEKHPPNRYQF